MYFSNSTTSIKSIKNIISSFGAFCGGNLASLATYLAKKWSHKTLLCSSSAMALNNHLRYNGHVSRPVRQQFRRNENKVFSK
jgi:hypothetical protein